MILNSFKVYSVHRGFKEVKAKKSCEENGEIENRNRGRIEDNRRVVRKGV